MASYRRVLLTLLLCGPFWQRSRSRRFARFAVLALYLYAGALPVLMALENHLLFPGATFARPWREPPAYLHVREVMLASGDGERIHAWFSAPDGWQPQHGAILYSHGNGSNLSRISGRAYRWREPFGRAVLLYDYPGYGKSSGRPSEAGCYAAGEAALHWLTHEQGVPLGEIILAGESLGCAIAVELATRHEARMLVLHGGFTSFPDMAQVRFPMYPSRYLVRSQMNNEAKIGDVRCGVFITHGTADSVVPFRQGERLYAAASEPKRFVRLEGGKHGPPNQEDYFAAIKRFLDETGR